jgi:hypothetical protein
MELYSGKPIGWNFGWENDIQNRTTRDDVAAFGSEVKADCTMAILKRTAARAA